MERLILSAFATVAGPALFAAGALPWVREKKEALPSILNPNNALSDDKRYLLIGGILSTVTPLCMKAIGAGPVLAAASGAFSALAALDMRYRRVPIPVLAVSCGLSLLSAGPERWAGNLLIGLGASLGIWALSGAVSAVTHKDVFGLGDVFLVAGLGFAFGANSAAWGRFLIASIACLSLCLIAMKMRDDQNMVPLFALALPAYIAGITGVL